MKVTSVFSTGFPFLLSSSCDSIVPQKREIKIRNFASTPIFTIIANATMDPPPLARGTKRPHPDSEETLKPIKRLDKKVFFTHTPRVLTFVGRRQNRCWRNYSTSFERLKGANRELY